MGRKLTKSTIKVRKSSQFCTPPGKSHFGLRNATTSVRAAPFKFNIYVRNMNSPSADTGPTGWSRYYSKFEWKYHGISKYCTDSVPPQTYSDESRQSRNETLEIRWWGQRIRWKSWYGEERRNHSATEDDNLKELEMTTSASGISYIPASPG